MSQKNSILVISLPRGLYRLTKCLDCKFTFRCSNCDNNLTTIKQNNKNILLCSECQTEYPYPKNCTSCKSYNLSSLYGGRDYLQEKLDSNELKVDVSNKIFDIELDYTQYQKIIITHCENLFLGVDYQAIEETCKSLTELLINLANHTEVVFDNKQGNQYLEGIDKPLEWFSNIMAKESMNREKFFFPPANNLILFTANEKTNIQAIAKLQATRQELLHLQTTLQELGKPSHPYEARILRRKGLYSMHLYLKYPKNYSQITELNSAIRRIKKQYNLIVRLNPRHIF